MLNPLGRRWLRSLFLTLTGKPRQRSTHRKPFPKLSLEALEARLAPAAQSIVFFESAVAGYQVLQHGLSPGTDAVVLDSGGDGLREMAAYLAGRHDLKTIGLVAHGSAGSVALGTETLNVQNLAAEAPELATIGAALAPGGEWDLWSCDVAQGQAGATFLQDLSAVTGAAVAAASEPVGAAALGGVWQLDTSVGGAQGIVPFTAPARADFTQLLSASWSPAASLATARAAQTAVLLGNGKVLVIGGLDSNGVALTSAELYDPVANSWSPAGSLTTGRAFNTATLLGNGKVLVTGGSDVNNNALASAEVYDPVTNKWSTAGLMGTAREFQTATLMANGKVLIVGGDAHGPSFKTAEIYDPVTNSWSLAASLSAARTQHTATLLANGQVLVVGGLDTNGNVKASAEVYDPVGNTWSPAGSLTVARNKQTATLLPSGKVLVVGGDDINTIPLESAEIYDPIANAWTPSATPINARDSHTAVLLGTGRVLVTGGNDSIGNPLVSAELYDPVANSWTATAPLALARYGQSGTLLSNGKMLEVGGGTAGPVTATAELYDPDVSHPPGAWNPAVPLTTARANQTATLIGNGKVLVVGGSDSGGRPIAGTELYDPTSNSWSLGGALLTARFSATATLLGNGLVMAAGGHGASLGSPALASAELYSAVGNVWTAAASMITGRYEQTATLLANGKVLVAGGLGNTGALFSAELYDPLKNTWSATGSLLSARYNHTATLLPNGKVLVTGGVGASGNQLNSSELYDPAINTWSAAASLATARTEHTATLLPSGKVLVTGGVANINASKTYLAGAEIYDPQANSWSLAGNMATPRSDHTATLLATGKVLVAGGENSVNNVNGVLSNSAELYDPIANAWSPAGSLALARDFQSATLLPTGKVLVAGGNGKVQLGNGGPTTSAELYDPAATDPAKSTVVVLSKNVPVGTTTTITLIARDAAGVQESQGGLTFSFGLGIGTGQGTLTGLTDNQNGTYTAAFTATLVGPITITGTLNGQIIISTLPTITVTQAQTTTTLVSGLSPSTYGQAIAFTAAVTANSAPVTSGTVTFEEGSTILANNVAVDAAGHATFTIANLSAIASPHAISALYNGTTQYLTSNGGASQTVTPLPITITADAESKMVGAADPALTYQVTSGTLVAGDSFTGSLTRAAGENPGTYPIQQGALALSGNYTLSFSGANLTIIGPASQFIVSNVNTTSVTAGGSVSFTVTAEDALSHVVTGYTGTVQLTSSDGQAVLGAPYTFVAGDKGAHPFTVMLATAGSQTITLTDQANKALAATIGPIAVSPGPLSQFLVSALGSNTLTAGNAFLVTVQAADKFGNAVNRPSGLPMVAVAPLDTSASVPFSVPLSPGGFGFFLATLKTKGTYTISVNDVQDSISGSSSSLAVNPAAPVYFKVDAPISVNTNTSFPVTVTALDSYNNVASNYTGTVHLTSTDSAATLAGDLGGSYSFTTGAGQDNGVHVFNVQLLTGGSQTITAADTTATMPAILGTSGAIATSGLVVTAISKTPTGFTAAFNQAINPADLTIYGIGSTQQDVLLVGATSNNAQPYPGTLIVDASKQLVTFNVSASFLTASSPGGSAALPDDTYTVTLVSGIGNNGFQDVSGLGLSDGHGGHGDFSGTFTTTYQADKSQVLGIVDFARGPNASGDVTTLIKVPNDPANGGHVGIPITLYNAANLTSAGFTLTYNADILSVTGGISDPANAAASFQMTSNVMNSDGVHAVASFTFTRATPASGTQILGDITAYVPYSARGKYQVKDLLAPGNITVNGGATVVPADAVDVDAYFGDVNADHHLDGIDKGLIANVASTAQTGFAAFTLLDPALIGDLSGDEAVTANSTSLLSNYLLDLPGAKIPALPNPPIVDAQFVSPFAFDPTLSLPATVQAACGLAQLPIYLDHARPTGSTGLVEARLTLTYDPAILSVSAADITLGSIPSQGSGWQLSAAVNAATGQITIELYSQTPITTDQAGSLVNIAFHVKGDGATTVQLVDSQSLLADAQAAMLLGPGLNWTAVLTSDWIKSLN